MITTVRFINRLGFPDMESPKFVSPTEAQEEYFFEDYLGGELENQDLFWNADISQDDDVLIVDWLNTVQTSCQQMVEELRAELGGNIPDFNTWTQV